MKPLCSKHILQSGFMLLFFELKSIRMRHHQHPYINFFFTLPAVPISILAYLRNSFCPLVYTPYVFIAKKWPRLFSRNHSFISTIICPCFRLSASTRLLNCFVCNFFSSSVGFNLCSCFCRLTLVFRFRFRPSLGRPVHGFRRFPSAF